jgi:hypothetical protein
MAEIFLSYILSFVDFIYKVAVVAFVAKQFGYISGPKVSDLLASASSPTGSAPRGVPRRQAEANPLGDAFKGIFEQMAPLLSGIAKGQPKTPMSFSDEVADEAPATPTVGIIDTPAEVVTEVSN